MSKLDLGIFGLFIGPTGASLGQVHNLALVQGTNI